MVKLTLVNRKNPSIMKLEIAPTDKLNEIAETAIETWGFGSVVLRSDYSVLDLEESASTLKDGSTIEVLPDPFLRC